MAQPAEPPVPADPLELATDGAQPVQDVAQRAKIVNLLIDARRKSNVRAQPYDLKTSFVVSGSASSDGMWQMEDTSPKINLYRWTVQGPNYSAVHLNVDHVVYSSQSPDALPLRLLQAREAIFYANPIVGPRAAIRTANGTLNGAAVVCALVTRFGNATPATGGRLWEEEEYCVDPTAGTLMTYSLVPGLYVLYDYSKGLTFHGKLIPNKFTITEAGQTVIEAETESVSDPANNPQAFQTAGLNQIGVGPIMNSPSRFSSTGRALAGRPQQFVTLRGVQSPDGNFSDVAVLAATDASARDAALAFVNKRPIGRMAQNPEPGVTPQSQEILFTLENPRP